MIKEKLIANPEIDRCLKMGAIDEALSLPIKKDGDAGGLEALLRGSQSRASDGGSMYAGLTLGDFLYDYARINPTAMKGIDFASAENLSSRFGFADFVQRHSDMADGAVDRLNGYVAEQFVAAHQQALGHDVSFPDAPNQPGFDLLVDGEQFQVKCVSSAQAVRDHIETHPDIPVIVNREIADSVEGLPGVHVDGALSIQDVEATTRETLDAGAELVDFEVPWISFAVASAMGIRDLVRNDTDLQGAITNVLTDTAARITVGTIGEWSGSLAGAALFGPAGAIVGGGAGAISGGVAGAPLAKLVRRVLTKDEEVRVRKALAALAVNAVAVMPEKTRAWRSKQALLETMLDGEDSQENVFRDYVHNRMGDEIAYFDNKGMELRAFAERHITSSEPTEAASKALVLINRAGVHPHHLQADLERLFAELRGLAEERKRYRLE